MLTQFAVNGCLGGFISSARSVSNPETTGEVPSVRKLPTDYISSKIPWSESDPLLDIIATNCGMELRTALERDWFGENANIDKITHRIARALLVSSHNSYHSVDIKGLCPSICEGTGTPSVIGCWVKHVPEKSKTWIKVATEPCLGWGASLKAFSLKGVAVTWQENKVNLLKPISDVLLLPRDSSSDIDRDRQQHKEYYTTISNEIMPPSKSLGNERAWFQKRAETFSKWRKRVSFKELLSGFLAIANQLTPFHERKIAHGDIKPANLFYLHPSSRLGDFNLASSFMSCFHVKLIGKFYQVHDELRAIKGLVTPNTDVHGLMVSLAFMFDCIGTQEQFIQLSKGIKERRYIQSFLGKVNLDDVFKGESCGFKEQLEQIRKGDVFADLAMFLYYCNGFICIHQNQEIRDNVKEKIKNLLLASLKTDRDYQKTYNASLFRLRCRNMEREIKSYWTDECEIKTEIDDVLSGVTLSIDMKKVYASIRGVLERISQKQQKANNQSDSKKRQKYQDCINQLNHFRDWLEKNCLSSDKTYQRKCSDVINNMLTIKPQFSRILGSAEFAEINACVRDMKEIEDHSVFVAMDALNSKEGLDESMKQLLAAFRDVYEASLTIRGGNFFYAACKFREKTPAEIQSQPAFIHLLDQVYCFYSKDTRDRNRHFDLADYLNQYEREKGVVSHDVKDKIFDFCLFSRIWHDIFFQALDTIERSEKLYNFFVDNRGMNNQNFESLEALGCGTTLQSVKRFLEKLSHDCSVAR